MSYTRSELQLLISKCHRILRDNDKLSPEAAFDAIAEILFIKIQNEKENGKNAILTPDRFVHARKSGGLKRESIEKLIDELAKYNLAETTDDVKGMAFESLLGKTFRGKLGQFFTPRPIVDFMVKILDPGLNDMVCDPCCGSGGFLIKVFQHVREKMETDFCNRNLFGVDANPRMARVAKMNMVMHGDGCGGVYHHDGLLDVGGIFENRFDVILTNPPFGGRVSRDITVTAPDLPSGEKTVEGLFREYGSEYGDALERLKKHVGKPLRGLYDLGKVSGFTEVLFIERCLRLLKPGGRMGIVLPDGVLGSDRLQKVRDYVEDRAKLLLIVSLPREVFRSSGAAVKSSVVFLKKFTEAEGRHYSNLVRIHGSIREEVKQQFDYEIFLADVLKAGISSTGGPDENQLPGLAMEYESYRRATKQWE